MVRPAQCELQAEWTAPASGSRRAHRVLLVALLCVGGIENVQAHPNVWTSGGPQDQGMRYVTDLVIDPQKPRILYAAAWGAGVFKSTDHGDHWNPASTGLTDRHVMALAIDPQTPSIVYAATGD